MKNEAIFSTFTIFRKLPTTTKSCSNQFQFNIIPKLGVPTNLSISLILMLPKEVNFSKMMMMIISSSINDNFNSQLCSQSPYVLHSILVISSPEMHGTFILNVAYLICEPNFASTQSRPPSGWN